VDVLSIGEMVIDFLPGSDAGTYIRNAGGAPANVAIAVARNGLAAGFIGKMGRDDFGDFLIRTLEENGVANVCRETTPEAVTTMTFVTLQADGERTFTFVRKPGADMFLSREDIPPGAIEAAAVVHAGSCSLSKSPAAETTEHALRMAREAGKLVSFDVNYRAPLWSGDTEAAARRIRAILPYVDLLKISDEEVGLVGGERNIRPLMAEHGIAAVVLTKGAAGADAYFGDTLLHVPGRKAKAVDATGAGDAFWGGFLSSLLQQGIVRAGQLTAEAILTAMRYGNVAGWVCVQTKGAIASLPTKAQILAHLAEGNQ
jgi:fructokinase